jgi:hypothetical protein
VLEAKGGHLTITDIHTTNLRIHSDVLRSNVLCLCRTTTQSPPIYADHDSTSLHPPLVSQASDSAPVPPPTPARFCMPSLHCPAMLCRAAP